MSSIHTLQSVSAQSVNNLRVFRFPGFLLPLLAIALCCAIFPIAGFAESAYIIPSPSAQGREWSPQPPREGKWKKIWKWSAAALVAGSAMDAGSSWGYAEANPMLRSQGGHLHGRGTAIKFGVLAGALVGQHYLLKKNPEMTKPLAITNFAVGAAYSGVAIRNWRVR